MTRTTALRRIVLATAVVLASGAPLRADTVPPTRPEQEPAASAPSARPPKGKHADPTAATAQCKDGSYSHSHHRSRTCAKHGGVATWLSGS